MGGLQKVHVRLLGGEGGGVKILKKNCYIVYRCPPSRRLSGHCATIGHKVCLYKIICRFQITIFFPYALAQNRRQYCDFIFSFGITKLAVSLPKTSNNPYYLEDEHSITRLITFGSLYSIHTSLNGSD